MDTSTLESNGSSCRSRRLSSPPTYSSVMACGPTTYMMDPTSSSPTTISENHLQIIQRISTLRGDPSLCDVQFLVRKQSGENKRMLANSTVLAMRSQYFKRLFFGDHTRQVEASSPVQTSGSPAAPVVPNRKLYKEIVIEDVDAASFQKLLDFIDGSSGQPMDDDGDGFKSFRSTRSAWEMQRLSTRFDVEQLRESCERYLTSQLTYRNAIDFLVQATTNGATDLKHHAFRIMKNRGLAVVTMADGNKVCQLDQEDVSEIIRLYSYLKTDYIIKFLQLWGCEMDSPAFKDIFRSRFFYLIRWDQISKQAMKDVHDQELLDPSTENQALMSLVMSEGILPQNDLRHLMSVRLNFAMQQYRLSKPFLFANSLLVKISKSARHPCYMRGSQKGVNGIFQLEQEGNQLWQQLLQCGPVEEFVVDADDVNVFVKHDTDKITATGLSVRVFSSVRPFASAPNSEVFLMEVAFDAIALSTRKNASLMHVEVAVEIDSALLDDLSEGDILTKKVTKLPRTTIRVSNKVKCEVSQWFSGQREGDRLVDEMLEVAMSDEKLAPMIVNIGLK